MATRARRLPHRGGGSTRPHGQAARRPNAHQRGYDRRWRSARRRFLADHPTCRQCDKQGRTIAATVVDHVRPHRGNEALFWDPRNWQPLCKRCHDRKTAAGQ